MATPLVYGKKYHIQNTWNKNTGGFLDTRGYQKDYEPKIGNFLCVTTSTVNNRDNGSGTWEIISASGKAAGTPVLPMDHIILRNCWATGGGFLDTRGYMKDFYPTMGNFLCVSTSKTQKRDGESTTWSIATAGDGTTIDEGEPVSLLNQWNNGKGGFLDTRGYQKDYGPKTGNHLCVSTAFGYNRDMGSGLWIFVPAK